jgi:hypothetical protein
VEGPCWDVVAALRDWLGEAECSAIVVELLPIGLQIHGLVRVDDWCVDGAGFHTLDQAYTGYMGGPLADDHQFVRMRAIGWHDPGFWGWGSLLIPPRSDLADELRRHIGQHLDQDGFLAALHERPGPGRRARLWPRPGTSHAPMVRPACQRTETDRAGGQTRDQRGR